MINELCKYGCGREGLFQTKFGKCCSKHYNGCPAIIKKKFTNETKLKMSESRKGKNQSETTKKKISLSNTGKTETIEHRKKISERLTGVKFSEDHKKRMSEVRSGVKFSEERKEKCRGWKHSEETKKKISETRIRLGIRHDDKILKRISESKKGKKQTNETIIKRIKSLKLTLDKIRTKYPDFLLIEELKEDSQSKELYGRCKYSECMNSKEKDGWFKLTSLQITERKYSFYKSNGTSNYFYCSDMCKNMCSLYHTNGDPNKKQLNNLPYTQQQYETWKKWVLEKDDYKCFYCNKKAEHVHHEVPTKMDAGQSLDPPNGISMCSEHHYEYGHKTRTECSTGNLAQLINKCSGNLI